MRQPLVIGHRGASGHRPEHTAAAYRAAYRMGAESVETDVVLTKDGVPLCRHDVDLAHTTDVAERSEFAERSRSVRRKGERVRAWLAHDFTLEEIRTLRSRERWPHLRDRSAAYDGSFGLLTLTDLLDLRVAEEAALGRALGVHVELKKGVRYSDLGFSLEDAVVDVLERRGLNHRGSGITLMAFETQVLTNLAVLSPVPRVQLRNKPTGPRKLDRIARYADGIGPRKELILPELPLGVPNEPTRLVRRAHDRGLDVLVWTLRSENHYLPAHLRRGKRPRRHGDAAAEVREFLDAGVDAVITDFPDVAVDERARTAAALAG